MLSILRKTQEITIQLEPHEGKLFTVDVFDNGRPSHKSPWLRIGQFSELRGAIEACKKVVDDFLSSSCVYQSRA